MYGPDLVKLGRVMEGLMLARHNIRPKLELNE